MSIFDRKKQVDVAVLDFSKALDVVPHRRLLGKLRHCGIDGLTLAWIESFLSGRSQRIIVDGVCSAWSPEFHKGLYLVRYFSSFIYMTYLIASRAEFDFLQMTV